MADDATRSNTLSSSETQAKSDETLKTSTGQRTGRRRSAYATRDLTKGSVPKNLWFLAWPQIAEGFLSVIDQFADLIWAGRIGFQAIAAIGVAQTYIMLTMTARMGLDAGMRSMVARAIGVRQVTYANHVFLQSINLTAIFVAIVVTLGVIFAESLLGIIGISQSVLDQATNYLRIQFLAMGMLAFHRMSGGALQAAGDSMTPLKAATVTRVVHLVFSPILIFGWLGFPEFGLAGAAIARLGAEWLGVSINFFALFKGSSRLRVSLKGYRFDLALIWRLAKVGAPASVTNMQRALTQLAMIGIVAPFGDGALAAFALTRRAENLVNQGSRGLGRAAGALAGQNLGAGYTERAKSALRWAVIYAAGGSLSVAALVIVFPETVASFFNSDTEFVSLAARWITVMAVGYFSISTVQVFTQGFNTSGATFAPMIITLVTVWVIDIPLAFIFSNFTPLGEFGVPWAIVTGMTLRLLAFLFYYFRGSWLKTGVM